MTNEKKDFYLGIASGAAVILFIALIAVSIAYFTKDSDKTAKVDNDVIVADDVVPTQPTDSKKNIKISKDDHIRGNIDAPITIIEFSDFQCPFCSRFHDTMMEVVKNYPDDVRWVYKHFPLDSIHPYARKVAEASECAGDQDKFWEYSDGLFSNQDKLSLDYPSELAKELGLNSTEFDKCLSSGKYAKKVTADLDYGKSLGVTGTPGGFINGQKLGGAVPYGQLESMIEALK